MKIQSGKLSTGDMLFSKSRDDQYAQPIIEGDCLSIVYFYKVVPDMLDKNGKLKGVEGKLAEVGGELYKNGMLAKELQIEGEIKVGSITISLPYTTASPERIFEIYNPLFQKIEEETKKEGGVATVISVLNPTLQFILARRGYLLEDKGQYFYKEL